VEGSGTRSSTDEFGRSRELKSNRYPKHLGNVKESAISVSVVGWVRVKTRAHKLKIADSQSVSPDRLNCVSSATIPNESTIDHGGTSRHLAYVAKHQQPAVSVARSKRGAVF
jgi:hypothetical protein